MFSTPQFRNWKVWNASSKIRKYSLFENIHLLKIHFFGTEIFRVDTQYLLLNCSLCQGTGPPKWSFLGGWPVVFGQNWLNFILIVRFLMTFWWIFVCKSSRPKSEIWHWWLFRRFEDVWFGAKSVMPSGNMTSWRGIRSLIIIKFLNSNTRV